MSNNRNECINNMNIISQIKAELNNFPSYSAQQKSDFFRKYGININISDVQKIDNDCGYLIATASSNIIQIPEECGVMIDKLCEDFKTDPNKYNQCVRNLRPKIINVNQSNVSSVSVNCNFNNYIDILKNDQSQQAKNMIFALQQKINDNNNENTNYCNNLNVNISDNSYINAHNACINSAIINNTNYLKTCYANKISQENYFDAYQNCMINNGVLQSTATIGSIIPDPINPILPVSSNFIQNYGIYAIIIILSCICLSIIVFLAYFYLNKK